jgi:NADH dehydrogenase FAD-containing subunit
VRNEKTRIVIAGGGFAGVYAAMYFDKSLARGRDTEVVLISRENVLLLRPCSTRSRLVSYIQAILSTHYDAFFVT